MLYTEAMKLNHLFNKDLMSTYYVLFIYSSTINTEVIKTDQVPAYYIVGGGRETLPRKQAVIKRQSTRMPGLSTWDLPPALSCLDKHIPCRPSHLGTIVPRVTTYLQLLHIIPARVLPFLPVTFIFKKSYVFFRDTGNSEYQWMLEDQVGNISPGSHEAGWCFLYKQLY